MPVEDLRPTHHLAGDWWIDDRRGHARQAPVTPLRAQRRPVDVRSRGGLSVPLNHVLAERLGRRGRFGPRKVGPRHFARRFQQRVRQRRDEAATIWLSTDVQYER